MAISCPSRRASTIIYSRYAQRTPKWC